MRYMRVYTILKAKRDISITVRAISLMKVVGIIPPIGMTDGVFKNRDIVASLEGHLNLKIETNEHSQVARAIGDALLRSVKELYEKTCEK